MQRLRYENESLDAFDARLLEALIDNARTSLTALARMVGLSPPSVSERIKRMEEAGVIRGYTLALDPEALGLPITAWLRIRPMPGQLAKVVEILRAMPEIVECDRVTGEDCFLARAHLASVEDLEAVIDEIIPYAMTNTAIVQSSPVPRRLPLVQPVRRREPKAG